MQINSAYQTCVPIIPSYVAGGQAPVRRAHKQQEGRSKKQKQSARVFIDGAAGHSPLAEGLSEGQETMALPSGNEQSDYSETSQESQAPSDNFLGPEDDYDEADVADLRNAEIAAAEANLLSKDSVVLQRESMVAGSRKDHDTTHPQAIRSWSKGGVLLPKTICLRPTDCYNAAKRIDFAHAAESCA